MQAGYNNIMEWQWNGNGKRCKISIPEDSKKIRIGTSDVLMEDEDLQYKFHIHNLRSKLDRELSLYKRQLIEKNYLQCCSKRN